LPKRVSSNSLYVLITILFIAVIAGVTHAAPEPSKDPLPFQQGSWTIVVLPDTQRYVLNDENHAIFMQMTQWIKENKKARNIKMVLHVGDITDNNTPEEWAKAKASMSVLNGQVPYIMCIGNHDLVTNGFMIDRTTLMNTYFHVEDNPLNKEIFGDSYGIGLENAYYLFNAGGRDYMVLSLEFGPRQEVIDWANRMVAGHPVSSIILITHDFMDERSRVDTGTVSRTTPTTDYSPSLFPIGKNGDAHCGEETWEELVSKHPNFEFVFSGHQLDADGDKIATGHRSDTREKGYTVHQTLFNAQESHKGGEGWLRLVEFRPDGTVQHKTYSPYKNEWKRTEEYEFSVKQDSFFKESNNSEKIKKSR
jgi:hypothetical protein